MISIIKWSEKWMPDVEGGKLEAVDQSGREVALELIGSDRKIINEFSDVSFKMS